MRLFRWLLLIFGLCRLYVYAQISGDTAETLYNEHRWFELRDDSAHIESSPFYKAAVETAFHQDESAERDLNRLIASRPNSDVILKAHELLLGIDFRNGRYHDALLQAQDLLAGKPDSKDIANILPSLQLLDSFGRQTVSRHGCLFRCNIRDQNVVLPVSINGRSGHYILDNGFSFSGMSESEARRLELTVHTISTQIDTMSGTQVKVRLAVVPQMLIGDTSLKNVAFYVLPDNQPPFTSLPERERGILGLQVVLALGHFKWQPQKKVFQMFPGDSKGSMYKANLAFDGTSIFTQLIFRKRHFLMSLDTGAEDTVLYPSFAKSFPDLEAHRLTEMHRLTGVGGSVSLRSFSVPALRFEIGDHPIVLSPATILLEQNNNTTGWFQGNLGMNVLNQAQAIDVDLGSMRLTLR